MINLKTISVVTLALSFCAVASHASAQTSPQDSDNAAQVISTVKSAEAKPQDMPRNISTRKIKRIVKPLPTSSQMKQSSIQSGVINAATSEQNINTRFIYNRSQVETHMPIYFSKESLKSK